jgi:hypothetical protein
MKSEQAVLPNPCLEEEEEFLSGDIVPYGNMENSCFSELTSIVVQGHEHFNVSDGMFLLRKIQRNKII